MEITPQKREIHFCEKCSEYKYYIILLSGVRNTIYALSHLKTVNQLIFQQQQQKKLSSFIKNLGHKCLLAELICSALIVFLWVLWNAESHPSSHSLPISQLAPKTFTVLRKLCRLSGRYSERWRKANRGISEICFYDPSTLALWWSGTKRTGMAFLFLSSISSSHSSLHTRFLSSHNSPVLMSDHLLLRI